MREISYRGKCKKTGKWVFGSLFKYGSLDRTVGKSYILDVGTLPVASLPTGFLTEVDPATVGQYIGIEDKNGVRIFEGDMVAHCDGESELFFDTENARFDFRMTQEILADQFSHEYQITGNIHDGGADD